MSRITEYIKLLPKALINSDKIIEGVINRVKFNHGGLPEDEQDEIIKRRVICAVCPFMSSNAVSNPSINYKSKRFDEHCILCDCNIELKTSSLSSNCGIEVYNEEHPKTPMELKWESYKNHKDEQEN